MHGQMCLFPGVHSYTSSFNTFADNLCVTVFVCGQSDQKRDKLIAMATSPCTEKEELRTLSTKKNGITCSTECQQKMKEQCMGNLMAEITSKRLLFCFVIKSKLAQNRWINVWFLHAWAPETWNRTLSQLEKKCWHVNNFHSMVNICTEFTNKQLNVLIKISVLQ